MSGKLQQSVDRFWRTLDSNYEPQRYTTIAEVTAVTTDTGGRVTSVVARIDGATGQTVQVGYGAPLGVGSLIAVQNHGEKTHPTWRQADIMQGVPAGYVAMLIGPGGQPYIGPQGVVSPAANLLRNPDFTLRHRLHENQPIGWVVSGQTQILESIGDE
jgi:hypothetical protein